MANYLRYTWQACDPSAFAEIKADTADKDTKTEAALDARHAFTNVDDAKAKVKFDSWDFENTGASAIEWTLEDSDKTLVLTMNWADGDTDKMATFNESAKGWHTSAGRYDASLWNVEANADPDHGFGTLYPGAGTTGNKVVINDNEV